MTNRRSADHGGDGVADVATEFLELAFYYPNPVWRDSDWAKNLILFFDGIALLVPEYMADKPFRADPALATGLQEAGLLKVLEPERFMDREATEKLAEAMVELLASGVLDLLVDTQTEFHELSYSRLGSSVDEGLARMILEELQARQLARASEDGFSIPMHPMVRALILILLAHLLKPAGRAQGLDLSPATDRPEIHNALSEVLGLPSLPSAGHVVSTDLQTVGIDLTSVPIEDVLAFRKENGQHYRAYARELRSFLREVGGVPEDERPSLLADRTQEIRDRAADLQNIGKQAWHRPARFALGAAGAVWNVVSGDPLGGLLALGTISGRSKHSPQEAEAYSYLFRARGTFPP